MHKGFCIVALLAILVVPMTTMAGMWIVPDETMGNVSGQAGLNIDISTALTAAYISYGDSNGGAHGGVNYTSPGYLNLTNVKIDNGSGGNLVLQDFGIDVGSSGGNTALIFTLADIDGRIDIGALKLNNSVGTGGYSVGHYVLENLSVTDTFLAITAN